VSEKVTAFSISITDESDKCRTVRIIFDRFNASWYIVFVELEVDISVEFLVSSSLVSNRDTTIVITTRLVLE
jgi:hypothetical protein